MLFKDVMVNPDLKNQLVSLVNDNRISHAQLFLTQPGNHSFALAMAYAQYIHCANRTGTDSCGVCPSCQKYNLLSHPDLHFIFPNCITQSVKKDPDSFQFSKTFRDFVLQHNYHIGIEDWLSVLDGENKQATINIRDCSAIINKNGIRSYEGGYKIFIVWCLDRLYHAAAPKLLKTLEEPSDKTLFILITENADKILPTILSRTQLVKIPKLTKDVVAQQLMKDYKIDVTKAEDIAAIADGNYIKAIELQSGGAELTETINQVELLLNSMVALKMMKNPEQIRFADVQQVFSDIISRGREEQKQFFQFLTHIFRNILMAKYHNASLVNATNEEKIFIAKFKDVITLKNSMPILNECNRAIYHIERNGNSMLVFMDFYLKMSQLLERKVEV